MNVKIYYKKIVYLIIMVIHVFIINQPVINMKNVKIFHLLLIKNVNNFLIYVHLME